jgi:hypothetical protein
VTCEASSFIAFSDASRTRKGVPVWSSSDWSLSIFALKKVWFTVKPLKSPFFLVAIVMILHTKSVPVEL